MYGPVGHEPLRLTLAEWAKLAEDDDGELVDGQLVEEEVPDAVHETIVRWLLMVLSAWIIPRGGLTFASELKFAVRRERGRKPDLSVYLPSDTRPPRRGVVRVPPAIMIEVVSPSPRDARRDRVDKLAEYAEFGVRFYWIVDPAERLLEVYELGDNRRYQHALGASEGAVESIPGCDGLTVDLSAMWAEADKLGPEEADGE